MSRIKLLLLYLTLNMFLLIESFKSKEILLTLFVVIAVVFVVCFFIITLSHQIHLHVQLLLKGTPNADLKIFIYVCVHVKTIP